MKSAIAVILIAGLGFAAWHYQKQARNLTAKVATLEEELVEARRDLEKFEKATTIAKADPEKGGGNAPISAKPASGKLAANPPSTVAPATTAPQSAATGSDLSTRIAQIESDYDRQKMALDARQREIDVARIRAESFVSQAEAKRPQFSEPSPRFNSAGRVIGNQGIRVSQADRDRAMEIYNQEVAAAKAGMAKVEEEQAKLEAQRSELYRSYRSALDAARRQ